MPSTRASSRGLWSLFAALALVCGLACRRAAAIDNGVANTPPRGWCSWQRYRCHIACNDSTSDECFNERLIKETADAMVSSGYRDAGYEYIALEYVNDSREHLHGAGTVSAHHHCWH